MVWLDFLRDIQMIPTRQNTEIVDMETTAGTVTPASRHSTSYVVIYKSFFLTTANNINFVTSFDRVFQWRFLDCQSFRMDYFMFVCHCSLICQHQNSSKHNGIFFWYIYIFLVISVKLHVYVGRKDNEWLSRLHETAVSEGAKCEGNCFKNFFPVKTL